MEAPSLSPCYDGRPQPAVGPCATARPGPASGGVRKERRRGKGGQGREFILDGRQRAGRRRRVGILSGKTYGVCGGTSEGGGGQMSKRGR